MSIFENRKGLKGCPFCGTQPIVEDWHGGPKTKRMISCENEECRVKPCVTGNTYGSAKAAWNCRIAEQPK